MSIEEALQKISTMRVSGMPLDTLILECEKLLTFYPWNNKILHELELLKSLRWHTSWSRSWEYTPKVLHDAMQKIDIPHDDIYTAISKSEASFLYDFLHTKSIAHTLEVGIWYGVSAIAIMKSTHAPHIIIDPFQRERFDNRWLENIQSADIKNTISVYDDYSHIALPKILEKGIQIDFAFIDWGHKFDDIFLDFYYIDLLLVTWWYVCFHDTWLDSTKHVISWIENNKKSYTKLDISETNMCIFQKTSNHERAWDHFKSFSV